MTYTNRRARESEVKAPSQKEFHLRAFSPFLSKAGTSNSKTPTQVSYHHTCTCSSRVDHTAYYAPHLFLDYSLPDKTRIHYTSAILQGTRSEFGYHILNFELTPAACRAYAAASSPCNCDFSKPGIIEESFLRVMTS